MSSMGLMLVLASEETLGGITMKTIRRKDPRPKPLKRQRDVLCDVMLSAGACETWLTLVELSRVTHYGEASISAQLRNLRKPQYGAFVVEKRQREAAEVLCGVEHGPVWEYRLSHALRLKASSAMGPKDDGSVGSAVAVC
jgi:hypothetical protein